MMRILILLLVLISSWSCWGSERQYRINSVKISSGDDINWSKPSFDDRNWERFKFQQPSSFRGNFWLRFQLTVFDDLASDQATELFFHTLGSSEIYWNGVLIDQNGIVGQTQASERPGQIDRVIIIPSHLYTKGEHTVAIRVSRHHHKKPLFGISYDFIIGPYGATYTQHTGSALVPTITLGGTLVIAIYFAVMFLLDRRRTSLLLFSICCLAVASMLSAETWRGVFNYGYDHHQIRLQIILSSAFTAALTLMWFVQQHFQLKQAKMPLAVISLFIWLFALLPISYDLRSAVLVLIGLVFSLLLSIWAWFKKEQGARFLVAGIVSCLAICLYKVERFIDEQFFYGFPVMCVFILMAIALKNESNRQQRDRALIQTERLRTALLKKNIQPHFLLNTLTSLSGWIAIEPKTADKLVQALAQQFRILLDVTEKPLISIEQELELCHAHLNVMGYRKDTLYQLKVTKSELNFWIPPGLLHTLIENALSHNNYTQQNVDFTLEVSTDNNQIIVKLTIPIGKNTKKTKSSGLSTGTGTKYIESRLEEAWPGRWSFTSHKADEHWHNSLSFPILECKP